MDNLTISILTTDGIISFNDFNNVQSYLNENAQKLINCIYAMGNGEKVFDPSCMFIFSYEVYDNEYFATWLSRSETIAKLSPSPVSVYPLLGLLDDEKE